MEYYILACSILKIIEYDILAQSDITCTYNLEYGEKVLKFRTNMYVLHAILLNKSSSVSYQSPSIKPSLQLKDLACFLFLEINRTIIW